MKRLCAAITKVHEIDVGNTHSPKTFQEACRLNQSHVTEKSGVVCSTCDAYGYWQAAIHDAYHVLADGVKSGRVKVVPIRKLSQRVYMLLSSCSGVRKEVDVVPCNKPSSNQEQDLTWYKTLIQLEEAVKGYTHPTCVDPVMQLVCVYDNVYVLERLLAVGAKYDKDKALIEALGYAAKHVVEELCKAGCSCSQLPWFCRTEVVDILLKNKALPRAVAQQYLNCVQSTCPEVKTLLKKRLL
jgi:hypothetical protein